jgi:mevalonate pyrophosphate decarboxylase
METIVLEKYIDKRNKELWLDLSKSFSFELVPTKAKNASCFAKNNNIQIFLNPKNSTSECFTHELLLVWLRNHKIFIGSTF